MRISSIFGAYRNCTADSYYSAPKFKNQNFRGLWGKTYVVSDINETMCIPQTETTRYYFPFNDEDLNEVKNWINSKKNCKLTNDHGFYRYEINDYKDCWPLPCSKVQYEAYMQLKRHKRYRMVDVIHNAVRDKYLDDNNGIDAPQTPAYNSIIEEQYSREHLFEHRGLKTFGETDEMNAFQFKHLGPDLPVVTPFKLEPKPKQTKSSITA